MSTTVVKDALRDYVKGLTKKYDKMVSHLKQPDIESADLITYLKGLTHCVLLLNENFEDLISVVLKVEWATREEVLVKEYKDFIENLVSANTYYLHLCLRMLIKRFYPNQRDLPPEYLKDNRTPIDASTRMFHNQIFSHVQSIIRSLCHIVPLAMTTLVDVLDECFPYQTRCVFTQESYVQNALKITKYLPSGRLPILTLIVSRMLQIDVLCSRNDIEEMEDDVGEEEADQGVFDMDGQEAGAVQQGAGCMRHPEAHKLDVMMKVMFDYIRDVCHHNDGTLNWASTKTLYRELLSVFEKMILPTYAPCHIQFLLFYTCSLREALHEGYLSYLWKYAQNPNRAMIHRQSVISYIASLLARATYISVDTVKTMLHLMCAWLHKYLSEASHSTEPVVWRHGPFYSGCQAVFYVIAFRHKEILATPKGHKWVSQLGLQTLITCQLNPLNVCLPVVAQTFANIARRHQIALCDVVIDFNKRSSLPIVRRNSTFSHSNKLDSFFPFDPYLLLRSNEYVSGIYRVFEGVVVEEPPETEEEDEFLDDLRAEETDQTSDVHTCPVDLMDYSISPDFKHI